MTQPPPSGFPQDPPPEGWQQQPPDPQNEGWSAPPPQYQPPQYQPPAQNQPQSPQHSAPEPPQPPAGGQAYPGQQPAWGAPPPADGDQWAPAGDQWAAGAPVIAAEPKPRGRAKLFIGAAVAVVLIGGGTATYVAVSDKNSGAGASSPQAAIKSIVDDLDKSDLIGVLNDLAPGERDALVNPFQDEVKQVKRLNVLEQNADPSKITGLTVSAANLTYASGTEKINDHVEIVKLTGGTIAINSDATQVPFTHDFLQTAFPNGLGNQTNGRTTLDIGQAVKQKGSPVRLAAQKVGGKWYPSIFYTFADAAAQNAGLGKPTASDYIPPAGAPSAEDAVKLALNAGLKGDLRQVIALTSPDELGALHDYGGLLLGKAGTPNLPDATIKDLSLTTQKITNGVHVSLSNITVDPGNGNEVKVAVVGKCVQVSAQGDEHKFCASDVMGQLNDTGVLPALDPAQKTAIQDLLSGVVNVGIDTAQSGGKWYINPVRSSLDLTNSLLSGLQGNDVIVLVKLIRSFAGR